MPDNELLKQFTDVKKRRDEALLRFQRTTTLLESAKERYNNVMLKLQSHGIGSLDELNAKINELYKEISDGIADVEAKLSIVQEAENAIDSEKTSVVSNG